MSNALYHFVENFLLIKTLYCNNKFGFLNYEIFQFLEIIQNLIPS